MMLCAGHPGLLGHEPLIHQLLDVIFRIPPAALMDRISLLSQRQRRDPIVLRHHDITGVTEIDEGEIHGVCSGANDFNVTIVGMEHMVRVT